MWRMPRNIWRHAPRFELAVLVLFPEDGIRILRDAGYLPSEELQDFRAGTQKLVQWKRRA
jgi:hypothetical protein